MNFSEFILAHSSEDPASLALSRARYAAEVSDFDLALTTLEVRRKLRDNVPEWYAVPSLVFPFRVSGEQCSSTATARYKASVALSVVPHPCTDGAALVYGKAENGGPCTDGVSLVYGGRIADLTGGLGVDSWAFAQVFNEVLYNEMRPELAQAAAHNFRELGVNNVVVRNYALVPVSTLIPGSDLIPGSTLIPGSDPGSPEASVSQILGSFRPDVLFLDPARRAADGRKVFRLEDCQPDVLQLLPELLAVCPRILLKLSPMADITLVCKQLGCVKAVHVVAADGECKELLLVLEKDWTGPHTLTIVEDGAVLLIPASTDPSAVDVTNFGPSTAKTYPNCGRRPRFWPVYRTEPGSVLFEPGKAMLKAGVFDLPCTFGLTKLGQHTHLYVGEEVPEALRPFGKAFRILEMGPLDKRSIKAFGQKYPQAEITARNIPLTSDQLRAKLGVRSGGSVHIFGLHIDAQKANYLIVAERYSPAP